MGEFELIQRFFTRPTPRAVLGVGDDCALLQTDTDPRRLGHKALAVNLSDLAACGARPLRLRWHCRCPRPTPPGWSRLHRACWRWPMNMAANW